MQIDPTGLTKGDGYKLLTNLIVPRPIAWVSTIGSDGAVNLAPFSFFNAISSDPLFVMISVGRRDDGSPKDTAVNIEASGEFVVNLVTEELFAAMNVSAADFPPGESEALAAGLEAVPSVKIAAPRLPAAQASLECRLHKTVPVGTYSMFIGEVVMFHVADTLVGPRLHIEGFEPLGRMGSPAVYARTRDRFDIRRIRYADWKKPQT